MEKRYCKLSDFKKIESEVVEHYPNDRMKRCIDSSTGSEYTLRIIMPEDTIQVKRLTPEEIVWHCGQNRIGQDIVQIKIKWFPKDLVAGIEGKFYTEKSPLSVKTGYIRTVNLGSNSEAFLYEKVQNALEILIQNGFEFSDEPVFK
jgi:hypothetical protein